MRYGAWLLCATLAAHAQSATDKGKRIVGDALAALGGPKFMAMEDRIEIGRAFSFYRERLAGLSIARIYTRYLSTGVRERQTFGKNAETSVLFNEEGAWEITFRGARPLEAPRLARYRDSARLNIFYILRQRLGEPGLILEWRSTEAFNNQPVEIVEITDADNRVVTVHFHQSTKLPVRQSFQRRDPVTKERDEEVTLYSKYRAVGGGVLWPFTIQRERNGEKVYEIFSDSVAINQNLTDDLFTLPINIKKLK